MCRLLLCFGLVGLCGGLPIRFLEKMRKAESEGRLHRAPLHRYHHYHHSPITPPHTPPRVVLDYWKRKAVTPLPPPQATTNPTFWNAPRALSYDPKAGTHALRPLNNIPEILTADINPIAFGAGVVSKNPLTVLFGPEALALDMIPNILSPYAHTNLGFIKVNPQLLKETISPNVLSPGLFMDLMNIDASPKALTQTINPCVLGPQLAMTLMKLALNPSILTSNLSPSVLCPKLALQLLKVSSLTSPTALASNLSPSALSPTLSLQLLEVRKRRKRSLRHKLLALK